MFMTIGRKAMGGILIPAACAAVLVACAAGRPEVKPGLSAEDQKAMILAALKGAEGGSKPGGAEYGASVEAPGEEGSSGVLVEMARPAGARPVENVSGVFRGLPLGDVLSRIGAQCGWAVVIEQGVPADAAVDVAFDETPAYEAVEGLARKADVAVRYDVGRKEIVLSPTAKATLALSFPWALRPLEAPLRASGGEVWMRYAQDPAAWIEQGIRGLLSREGRVMVDPISGTVVIEDRPSVVRRVAASLAEMESRLRPITLEVAVIRARKGGMGIEWSKVSRMGKKTPVEVGEEIAGMGPDVVANTLDLLRAHDPEVIARPSIPALSGWGVGMGVSLPGSGQGWQLSVIPHERDGGVLIEASGGFIGGAAQSFSTAARVRTGVPLLISAGAAQVVEKKSWGSDQVMREEVIFVIWAS